MYVVLPRVTAEASERGEGRFARRAARPAANASTLPTVPGVPPPNTMSRPPTTDAAASCTPTRRDPIGRSAPLPVSSENTPLADDEPVRPPSTTRWVPLPGSTTSRDTGVGRCHGRSPDSTAEIGSTSGTDAWMARFPAPPVAASHTTTPRMIKSKPPSATRRRRKTPRRECSAGSVLIAGR